MSEEANRVHQVEVAATLTAAWEALTNPEIVRQYYYDTAPRTTWEIGFADRVRGCGRRRVQIVGEVLEHDPPRRPAHTSTATCSTAAATTRVRCTGRSSRRRADAASR